MLTLRSVWALAAALAAACSFSAPTPAASNICRSTYSYAGITAPVRANGIRAALAAVSVPNVVEGHVAGWIGVGGPGLGPGGSDEWIQIGLSAFPGSGSIMYYEVKQPRTDAKYVELRSHIAPGERHRLAVLEVHGRPDVWRVWVDGAPVSGPYYLPRSHSAWLPQATAESWNGGSAVCNHYRYAFDRVSVATAVGGGWSPLRRSTAYSDAGYELRWRATASFVAFGNA